jgi:succinoglycan biosynthesis transport protein ExoP
MLEQNRANSEKDSPPPTAREVAAVLFRQSRIFAGVAGLIFVFSVVYAIFGESYLAHLSVMVRRGRSDPPVTGQQNAPPDFSRVEVTEEELNSEVELLRDDEVLRRVVESNNLAAHDWLRWLRPHEDRAAGEERATKTLAGRLKIEPIKKTNLIAVSYGASEPQLAARVLRSLSAAYLEKHKQVHRPAGELRFFDQQTEQSREQLEQAKRKLLEFSNTHGVVQAAQQRDLLLQRLDAFETSYGKNRVAMLEAEHRVRELEAEVAELPQRTTTQIRTADNPELLRALKESLLDLELKKTQLLTKFEPKHRLVQEIDQQILQAKSAIASEKYTPVRDETTDKDTQYEWAKGELQKARVEMNGLQAREAATGAEMNEYRVLARKLGEDAITQDDLASNEKAAEESYLLYVKKREEARVSDALDEGGIVNVAIAEPPIVPALPVWPAGLVVVTGLIAACGSGAGAAFIADRLDPALRTPEEVLACLDLPVLASLPAASRRQLSA